jgi:CRP-like cAMP-binding protein
MLWNRSPSEDDRFFVIEDGTVEFWKKDDSDPKSKPVLSGYGSIGDYFGELSLLTARPRQATAVAQTHVSCLTMKREDFNRLMGPCEEILQRNMSLYANYQQLMAREAERTAQEQASSEEAQREQQEPVEGPAMLSKSDLIHSLTLLQCITQDFLVATIDEALTEFAEHRIQLTGDDTKLLGQILSSIQEIRAVLSASVSEIDSALRQLDQSDEDRIKSAFVGIGKISPCFILYEQLAKAYFALRTGVDTGKILATNGNNEALPLSQHQLDYIDTLLSHPSNILMSLEELAPLVRSVLRDDDVKKFESLQDSFSAAYNRFMETKTAAMTLYEALRDHPSLVEHIGLRTQRVVLASARATIINDENPSDSPEVQVVVFSDYIAFIGDPDSPDDEEKKTQALPLWGCVLHLNETNHRADLHSAALGLVASFQIVDQTPEWLVKLRDAIELACSTSPLLSPAAAKSA